MTDSEKVELGRLDTLNLSELGKEDLIDSEMK
jgi:hypothetical protein